uniref:ATP synthase F0 subunit 6 n=1 Tax=Crassostrea talonata TaxID=1356040 RepID=A0A342KBB9_9BIVA|nr:ATP synthase F0 subunit 6 [Crassostrea talonata]ANC95450.1 ATP synthase F0 subunit 6 [Crassostrea talonata]ANC95462.1 ATP synthase F0 subunit 6 [Crassostrea talonata]UOU85755.1 ATP synthase F0 subunit 6 [Crassostrea talonata]
MSFEFMVLIVFFLGFSISYSAYFINLPSALFCTCSAQSMYKKLYVGSMHSKSKRFSALGEGVSEGASWVFDFVVTLVLVSILPWGFPSLSSWEIVAGLMPSMIYSVNVLQIDATIFSKSLKFKQSVLKSFIYFPLLMLSAVIRPITLTVRMLANALVGAILCHSLTKVYSYKVVYVGYAKPSLTVLIGVVLIWEMAVMLVQSSLFLGLSKIYFHPTPVVFKAK